MCQSKDQGGKRCQAHLSGSNATINTATIATGESRTDVTKVFQDLRKEGKKLEAPTPEMVQEFAESQRFQAAFNPDLSEAQRKRISNHWSQAVNEEPTGATFHAWKHTLSEVMRRARTKVAAVFAAGLLSVSLASCSNGGNITDDITPSPSNEPTISESIAPSASPSPSVDNQYEGDEYGVYIHENDRLGIEATGPEFTDSYGTYQRVVIADDSPLLEPTPSVYAPNAKNAWNAEQLEEGEKFTKRFALEHIMDNQSVYDTSRENAEAYLVETAPMFSSEWQNDWKSYQEDELPKQGLVAGKTDPTVPLYVSKGDATFPDYEEGKARYTLYNMELTKAELNPDDSTSVIYKYDIGAQRPANINTADGKTVKGFVNVNYELWLATRPTSDGKFELTGWYGNSFSSAYDAQSNPLIIQSKGSE